MLEVSAVPLPVTGQNIQTLPPHALGKRDVVRMIADAARAAEIDRVIPLCDPQEMGLWLDAEAPVCACMWADEDSLDRHLGLGEDSHQAAIHGVHVPGEEAASSEPRLVGHDEECVASGRAAKRIRGRREDSDLGRIRQITEILDDGPVAVQEEGRSWSGGGHGC